VSGSNAQGLQRVADLPIYRSDVMVRRADALQRAPASQAPVVRMHADTIAQFGLDVGSMVRVKSGTGEALMAAQLDNTVLSGTVRISAGFAQTLALGSAFGQLSVERA